MTCRLLRACSSVIHSKHTMLLLIYHLVCTYLVLVLALLLFYTTYSLEMRLIMMESKWYTKVLLTMQQNISIHISDTFNDFIVISKEIGLELLNIYSSENLLNHWQVFSTYNGRVIPNKYGKCCKYFKMLLWRSYSANEKDSSDTWIFTMH